MYRKSLRHYWHQWGKLLATDFFITLIAKVAKDLHRIFLQSFNSDVVNATYTIVERLNFSSQLYVFFFQDKIVKVTQERAICEYFDPEYYSYVIFETRKLNRTHTSLFVSLSTKKDMENVTVRDTNETYLNFSSVRFIFFFRLTSKDMNLWVTCIDYPLLILKFQCVIYFKTLKWI